MRMVVGWLVGLLSLFSKTEERLMSKQKKKKALFYRGNGVRVFYIKKNCDVVTLATITRGFSQICVKVR
jgi:hypothetical protein